MKSQLLCFLGIAAQMGLCSSLACFENVDGEISIVENESWEYCAVVPSMGGQNGSQFGMGPENDKMNIYNGAFGLNGDQYRILTVCILERYDFGGFLASKRRGGSFGVDFLFRCVCNFNLCNSDAAFSGYLAALKSQSSIV